MNMKDTYMCFTFTITYMHIHRKRGRERERERIAKPDGSNYDKTDPLLQKDERACKIFWIFISTLKLEKQASLQDIADLYFNVDPTLP